ncbi:MAG: spore maturation protein [Syntrophobacteraceae bacterium]|nr:spore maturation protein [Syntrophobacteraceae bacterium]
MNAIFAWIVFIAFGSAAWRQFMSARDAGDPGPMEQLSKAMVDSAGSAVELAIGLIGVMTLFLGLMKVAEAGGLLTIISRLIRPLMVRLFPDVPPDHPAMGAMILNLSANVMGLGNAATPFGIRAMQELNRLNTHQGTATNAMVLFLAINTSSVTLLPTGVIALRAAAGSTDPAGILPTTLFATLCSTLVAVLTAKTLQRFFQYPTGGLDAAPSQPMTPDGDALSPDASVAEHAPYPVWVSGLVFGLIVLLIPFTVVFGRAVSPWVMPGLMVGFLAFGIIRKVPVYETFVEGAKEGFQVAVRIIPYLVAILSAIGMFRASGAMDVLVHGLGRWTQLVGLPAEALSMALLRNLSGSGAYALLASIIRDPDIGPDSYTGYLVSTLQGSTETTFYVLAVYFGAVQIKRIRHALAAGLTADLFAVIASVFICSLLFQ